MTARLEVPVRSTAPLERRALSLGVANAIDYALQFLVPVVLVRCLEPAAFGQYRLVWLAVGTVIAVVTQAMPGSLYYFLPRSDAAAKRLYINQTLLFLVGAGVAGAFAVSAWNPWLPGQLRGLVRGEAAVPGIVLFCVVAMLLDLLPTAEERVAWQAKATVGLSTLRAAGLCVAALVWRDLGPLLGVLLAVTATKVAVLLVYVARYHGLRAPLLRAGTFAGQLRYAAPFGAAGALYGLRAQADQWVAATMFTVHLFAAFSVAAVLGPVVQLFRQSVLHAFLPSMSRLQAAGDAPGMIALNARSNAIVAAFVFPLLAFAFAFAGELVTAVYTAAYAAAAPVMRVYVVGLAGLTVELASVLMLLRHGAFMLGLGVPALALSVAVSFGGAHAFGLAGAAAGSVAALYLELGATLWRIRARTGIPLRRLQDWRALGSLLVFAATAATLARGVVDRWVDADEPLLSLAVGGTVLAAVYVAMATASGNVRRPPRGS